MAMARRGACLTCGSTVHNWGYTTPDGRYTCHMCCFSNRQATGFYGPLGSHSREEADGGFSRSCAECGANRTHSWRGHKQRPELFVCNACHMRFKRNGSYRRRDSAVREDSDCDGGIAGNTGGSSAALWECLTKEAAAVDTSNAATTAPHLAAAHDVGAACVSASSLPQASIRPAGHRTSDPSAPNGRAVSTWQRAAMMHGEAENAPGGNLKKGNIEDSGANLKNSEDVSGTSLGRGHSNLGARYGPCDTCGLAQSLRWYKHKMNPNKTTCQACYNRYRRRGTYGQHRAQLGEAPVSSNGRQQGGETASGPTGRGCGGSGKGAASGEHCNPLSFEALASVRPAATDGLIGNDAEAGTVAELPPLAPALPLPSPPLLDIPRPMPAATFKSAGPELCRKRQRMGSTECCPVCGDVQRRPLAAPAGVLGSGDDDRCIDDTGNPWHNGDGSVSDGDDGSIECGGDDCGGDDCGGGETGRRRGRYGLQRHTFTHMARGTQSSPPLAAEAEAPPGPCSPVVPLHPANAVLQDGLAVHGNSSTLAPVPRQGRNVVELPAVATAAAATGPGPVAMDICFEGFRMPPSSLSRPVEVEAVRVWDPHGEGEAAAAATAVSGKRVCGIRAEPPLLVASPGELEGTSEKPRSAEQAGVGRSASDGAVCTAAGDSGADGSGPQRCAECGSETTSHTWRMHQSRPGLVRCCRCYNRYRTGRSHKHPPGAVSTKHAGAAGHPKEILKPTSSVATLADEFQFRGARECGNTEGEDTIGDPGSGSRNAMGWVIDTGMNMVNGHSQPFHPAVDFARLGSPTAAGIDGLTTCTTYTCGNPALERITLQSMPAADTVNDIPYVESVSGGGAVAVMIARNLILPAAVSGSGGVGSPGEAAGADVGAAAGAHIVAMDTTYVYCEVCGSTNTVETMMRLRDGRGKGLSRHLSRLMPPLATMPRGLGMCRECRAALGLGAPVRQQPICQSLKDEEDGKEVAGLERLGESPLSPQSSPAAARASGIMREHVLGREDYGGKGRLVWTCRAKHDGAEPDAPAEGGGEDGMEDEEKTTEEEKNMEREEGRTKQANEPRATTYIQEPGHRSPLQQDQQKQAATRPVMVYASLPIRDDGDEQQLDEQNYRQATQQQVRPQAPCGLPASDRVPPAVPSIGRPGSLADGAEPLPGLSPDPHGSPAATPDAAFLAQLTQHFAVTLSAACEALVEMEDLYGIRLLEGSSRTLQPTDVGPAGGGGGGVACWPSTPSPPGPSPLRQVYEELCGSDRKLRAMMLGDLALRWLEDNAWRRPLELMLGRRVRGLGLDRVGPVEGLNAQQQANWDRSRRAVYSNFAELAQAAITAAAGRDGGGTASALLPRTTHVCDGRSTSGGADQRVSSSAIQHFLAVTDHLAEGLAGHLLGGNQTPPSPPGPSQEPKTLTKLSSPPPSLVLPPAAAPISKQQPVKPAPLPVRALVEPFRIVSSQSPTLPTRPQPVCPLLPLAPRLQPTTDKPIQLQSVLPVACELHTYPPSVAVPCAGSRHSGILGAGLNTIETVLRMCGTADAATATAMKIMNGASHTAVGVDIEGRDGGGCRHGNNDGLRGINGAASRATVTMLLRSAVHIAVHLAFQVGASSNGRLMLRLVSPGDPLPPLSPSSPPPPPPLQAAEPEAHARLLLARSPAPAVLKAPMAVAVEWLWSELYSGTDVDGDSGRHARCRPGRQKAKYPDWCTSTNCCCVDDNSTGSGCSGIKTNAVGVACMASKRLSCTFYDDTGMGPPHSPGEALRPPPVGETLQIRSREDEFADSQVSRNDGATPLPVMVGPFNMTRPPSLEGPPRCLRRGQPALDQCIKESAAFGSAGVSAASGASVLSAKVQNCAHHETASIQLLTAVARPFPPTSLPIKSPQLLLAAPGVQSLPPTTGEIIMPATRPPYPSARPHPVLLPHPSDSNVCSSDGGGIESFTGGSRHCGDASKRGGGDGRCAGASNSRDTMAAVLWVVSPAVVSRGVHWERELHKEDAVVHKSCQPQTSATTTADFAMATVHAVGGGGLGCSAAPSGDEGAGPSWLGRRVVIEVPVVPAHVVGCGTVLHRTPQNPATPPCKT